MFKNKFRKFNGDKIPDVIEYLHQYVTNNPNVTISIGCDSTQKRRTTLYAITIMLYNTDVKNGAHIIFYKESIKKIRDTQERLFKEAKYLYDLGIYLDKELSSFYHRKDLTDINEKRYKYHLLKCAGNYLNVDNHIENSIMSNLKLNSSDKKDYRLVDIHVDFNPFTGSINNGISKNKSYIAYKIYVPWLRGLGFRTWSKPLSFASTTAADLLIK